MLNGKKIAFYIRVARANEEDSSIDFQKKQLVKYYCEDKDISNYEFYIDNGYSGNNLERPALQRLIQDSQEKKLSHCIVYKLDRLSRSAKDSLHIINNILNPNGVEFVSLIDSLDTSNSLGKHIIDLYSMIISTKRGKEICQKTKR